MNHGCVFQSGTSITPEALSCSVFCKHVEIRLKGEKLHKNSDVANPLLGKR